ncbi:MAG: hypothetical protein IBX55_21030 [Methyloprofundus sp.]|nr:hypothetical protein [Methyloprofundus sp.]
MLCLQHTNRDEGLEMAEHTVEQIIQALEALDNITLHLQEKNQRINIRAYSGYDREKQRSSYVLAGSVDRRSFEPNERLSAVLGGSARIKAAFDDAAEKYKTERKAEYDQDQRNALKSGVRWYAGRLAEGLEALAADGDEITAGLAAAVYADIKRVESVLRKAGHKKTNQGG